MIAEVIKNETLQVSIDDPKLKSEELVNQIMGNLSGDFNKNTRLLSEMTTMAAKEMVNKEKYKNKM